MKLWISAVTTICLGAGLLQSFSQQFSLCYCSAQVSPKTTKLSKEQIDALVKKADKLLIAGKDSEAIQILTPLAEGGVGQAASLMSLVYINIEKNDLALEWANKAIKLGNADGYTALSSLYRFGLAGLPKDLAKSKELLQKAADEGSGNAACIIADNYRNGTDGYPKDFKLAMKYYLLAAKSSSARAYEVLGRVFMEGTGGLPVDNDMGKDFLLKGAKLGDAQAMVEVASIYFAQKDFKSMLYWTRKSMEEENYMGWLGMAVSYEQGYGVPKNHAKAVECAKHALKLDPRAKDLLKTMHGLQNLGDE